MHVWSFGDLLYYPTAIRLIVLATEIQNVKVHPFKLEHWIKKEQNAAFKLTGSAKTQDDFVGTK